MSQGYTTACRTRFKNIAFFALFLVTAILCAFSTPSFAVPSAKRSSTHLVFVKVKPGDTLYSIFRNQKIPAKTLSAILHQPVASKELTKLHLNQTMRFSLDAQNNLESFTLVLGPSKILTVFHGGGNRYIVRVENGSFRVPLEIKALPTQSPSPKNPSKVAPKPTEQPPIKQATTVKQPARAIQKKPTPPPQSAPAVKKVTPVFPPYHYTGMIIHTSLYGDARKYGVPYKLLNQLTKIFALQINFKDIHPGDKLLLAYDNDTIIAVKFIQKSRVYSTVRYVNAQGIVEYFSPDGESMKKAFNRFPVKYTHINSLFNMHRMHPVTHVIRPHTGVDLAGPLGTPIYSIGDGKISFIGWDGAYGNLIKVQHNDKYSSMYAHMLRFAPGLSASSYVKRGQLIGFLGQTGNATGPHVHFEVRVYNVPVNPLTVPLPQASAVPPTQIAAFKEKSKALMAALDYYQQTKLK